MQQIQLNVDDEIKVLGDTLTKEIQDVRAQKGTAAELADAAPALLTLAGNFSKLPKDLKSSDNIAYLVRCGLEGMNMPAVPVVPPAVAPLLVE